jgi:predicted dehydrogenase
MIRIGFVDHHLNNFHANKFLSLLRGVLGEEDGRVVMAWESHPTAEDWCARNGIPRAQSPEAVAAECDAVMVLAPDNIAAHAELCRKVFPAGKRTLVDKFLAPDMEQARRILDLARESGVQVFSASALRFAVELRATMQEIQEPASEAYARGMGEWNGYGVHTLSLAVGVMGADVNRVIDTGGENTAAVTLEYRDGRRAHVDVRAAANQWDALPWTVGFRVGDHYHTATIKDFDGFYTNLMREAMRFFQTGESPVSPAEMLSVVAILESANRSRSQGAWIELPTPNATAFGNPGGGANHGP